MMKDLALDREKMVRNQIERRGINHPGIIAAMRQVPRHLFVPMEYQSQAYADHPLPIGYDQTISQPYIVALMSELIQPQADDNVLEVGSGSGYQAAILSQLVAQVHSIERHSGLVKQAQMVINELNLTNVKFHIGDGSLGLTEFAPFDAIIITAAAPQVPRPLLDQLNIGGRLVLPVGERWHQTLERWTKISEDTFDHDKDIPVSFVPLVGKFGWADSDG